MLYRKKPVVIEAIQYNGLNKDEIERFVGSSLKSEINDCAWEAGAMVAPIRTIIIPTLEGNHIASPGDFIIKGIKGEFYPCKPDIFNDTYSPYFTACGDGKIHTGT